MIAEISIGTVVSFIVFWIVALPLLFWLETDKGEEFFLRYFYPEHYRWKQNEKWRKEWEKEDKKRSEKWRMEWEEEEADKEWKEWEEKLNKDDEKPQQFFRIRRSR